MYLRFHHQEIACRPAVSLLTLSFASEKGWIYNSVRFLLLNTEPPLTAGLRQGL